MRFADPFWLCFLVFAALPWVAHRRRRRLAWPTLDGFAPKLSANWRSRFGFLPTLLRSLVIAAVVVGLARPRTEGEQIHVSGRGLTIGLVVDRSSSMKTTDFPTEGGGKISRLLAAQQTLGRFLNARIDDLIAVVGFANLPDTLAPPTLDRRFVWGAIRLIRPAGPGDDGTDLGGAIAWGLGVIRSSPSNRKVLILLTDGRHAPGSTRSLDPVVAADVARGLGVTLHTVAIGRPALGTNATAPNGSAGDPPRTDPAVAAGDDSGPDFDLLKRLADRGRGRAFVASDSEALDGIFHEINALETSPIEGTIRTIYRERYAGWIVGALLLLGLDLIWSTGRFRRLP